MTTEESKADWTNATQLMRTNKKSTYTIEPDLREALSALGKRKVNLSALVCEALRAHPTVAAALASVAAKKIVDSQKIA